MLPAFDLPGLDAGPILLATLALVLVRPRAGLALHVGGLVLAVLADQTRLQPWVISMPLLMLASDPRTELRTIGRAHLATLWLWAGAHKLLSPAFAASTAPFLVSRVWTHAPDALSAHAGVTIALAELSVGALAIAPPTRRVAALAGAGLHAGIALYLLASRESPGLVPWNVALALAAVALLWTREPASSTPRGPRLLAYAIAGALALAPAGFYVGVTDAYVAHVLYTGDVDRTLRCGASGTCVSDLELKESLAELGSGFPPEPRLFRAHFEQTCEPGDVMHVTAPTTLLHPRAPHIETERCPREVPIAHLDESNF